MRVGLGCLLAGFALGCNAVLGMSETTLRGEAGAAGEGSGAASGTGATGGTTAAGVACSTHEECVARTGEWDPSACVGGHCVDLLTPECPLLLPDTNRLWLDNLRQSDPEAVIFGAFAAIPPTNQYGIHSRNYELVLNEVMREVGGLPAADGKRRPVLAVVCRNLYPSVEDLDRAVEHLTTELRVPGILGGLETADLEHAFRSKGRSNQVFFLSPYDSDRRLVELEDDGLVWQMLPGGEHLAPTYAPLLERTLEHLRQHERLAPGEDVRVALVTTEDVSALSAISGALTGGILQFNGQPARANSADNFREIAIASSVLSTQAPDYSNAIQVLRDLSPHVIIAAATDEFLTTIIPLLEAEPLAVEPFYLLSPWQADPARLRPVLIEFPELYSRLAGVNFAGAVDTTVYDGYQARFDASNLAFAGTRGYENHYDAFYYLIYAAAAAGDVTPLTGSHLARGMQRLLSGGPPFSVGPDDLLPAYLALEKPDSNIVLSGAMGPPHFDPDTGARNEPGSVWCADERQALHTDVLRLSSEGELEGDFPCFAFGEP